jgi:large subunit ribosomal protein L25
MDYQTIKATKRDRVGTKAARRLREHGQMPAIVYGKQADPEPIALPAHEVEVAIQHGSHLLQLSLDGKEQQYLIKDVQYDYLGTTPIHVDLNPVDIHEVVEVNVAIDLRGTPVGISEGGALDQLMMDLTVRCKVTNIPESIRPSVIGLKLGETLCIRDIELPDGVEAVEDGAEVVAVIRHLAEEPEPEAEEVEEAEDKAEPEIIGREKKEEEQEES